MICWINPFTGLAGDMLLAALVDAGAPPDGIRAAVGSTGLTGWELTAGRVLTHGLAATRVRVTVTDAATERRAAELISMAGSARPEPVAALAVAALRAIAEAEGAIHGVDPGRVHLHELGGHDALVDIVGVAAALHLLGVTAVHCAPIPLGTGTVTTRHGVLAPLRDAGMTKAEVRRAARAWGLVVWDKPAAPCLASRVAYGVEVTPARLHRIETAERAVRRLLARAGLPVTDLRVRDLGDRVRVELDAALRPRAAALPGLVPAVREAGFPGAEVEVADFRSGALNIEPLRP